MSEEKERCPLCGYTGEPPITPLAHAISLTSMLTFIAFVLWLIFG